MMGFSYLKDNNGVEHTWEQITRDERTFCMHLYHAFKDCPDILVKLIQQAQPLKEFKNQLTVKGKNWNLAYEVCFYRDLLFANGIKVRGDYKTLSSWEIGSPEKLIKRTFDLCLFSESEMIIIEAKAAGGLTSEQFYDFVKDKKEVMENDEKVGGYIAKVLGGLKREIPDIKLVILASSEYFRSSSFSLTNEKGVGRKCILETNYVDALVSWSEIAGEMEVIDSLDHEMILRADHVYLEKIRY